MSFSHHPFRHIDLIDHDDNGVYHWHCDGCGADGNRIKALAIPYSPFSPVFSQNMNRLIEQYHDHVRNSHGLTPEDVKDWSVM